MPALAAALHEAAVRYVTIGVGGANLWARSGHTIFTTRDYDLRDIVASKAAAGREKDRLFLAAHAEALRSLIEEET